jgi:hypothetical protein
MKLFKKYNSTLPVPYIPLALFVSIKGFKFLLQVNKQITINMRKEMYEMTARKT